MADQIVDIPGVGQVAFPPTMSDADISVAAKRLHDDVIQRSVVAAHGARQNEDRINAEQHPGMGELAGTAALRLAKNLVMAPLDVAKTAVKGVAQQGTLEGGIGALAHKYVIDPALAEGRKALDALQGGHYSEAAGHGAAAVLPGIGPAAANIGEEVGTGDPRQMANAAGDVAALALAGPATRFAGRLVKGAGEAMQGGGRSAFLRAAKIPDTIAKKTNAYRNTGGDLAAGEQEIANTLLERGQGAISRKNVNALNAERRTVGNEIGRLSRDPNVQIPSAPINQAMLDEIVKMAQEADPGLPSAINRAVELESSFGPTIPGDKAQILKVAAGARNANRFANIGNPNPGVPRVDMAMRGAIDKAQESAIPGLAEKNQQFSEVKPAAMALTKARQRIGHHDPIGLTQMGLGGIGSLLGGPSVGGAMALLSFLQRGGPLSRIAQALYSTGALGKSAGGALSAADQAAIIAQFANQSQQP